MPDAHATLDGVLVVDKPAGPTSHDIVAAARRALGTRSIGHTGTLDPAAKGVLVLVLGRATRLARYLGGDKEYEARIRFGRVCDTYDEEGTIVTTSDARPSRAQVDEALDRFRGTYLQVPPPYSAKKIGGVRAYELARVNQPQSPPAVPVSVASLELQSFDGETAAVEMVVSAGFYVRSLAHDLGAILGCGAVLAGLRRTRAGAFTLAQAVDASWLSGDRRGDLVDRLVPLDALLPDVPSIGLTRQDVERVAHGQDVAGAVAPLVRMVDERGHLVALATPGRRPGLLHPSVVLR